MRLARDAIAGEKLPCPRCASDRDILDPALKFDWSSGRSSGSLALRDPEADLSERPGK